MARWLVELTGDRFDVEDYPSNFPTGPFAAIEKGGRVFLCGESLEQLTDPAEVLARAEGIVSQWYSILSLQERSLDRPILGAVTRELDDGTEQKYAFLRGTARGRSKVRATLSTNGEVAQTGGEGQRLLAAAERAPHLLRALMLWEAPHRAWPRLYAILEEIEIHLGKSVVDANIATKKQRDQFTRTANSAEGAGIDARHGSGKFEPAQHPMSLSDATEFIRFVLSRALEKK
jgi:hypothetical protein